ncbi:helicase-related protein [Thermomonas sp. LB-4]|uniref:helicase-related protein n=1 Tax=Thermomonas sp. LB-4 TaxID=3102790 RepID=UPI002EDB3833
MKLDELAPGMHVLGVAQSGAVEVVAVTAVGPDAVSLVFRAPDGAVAERMLFRQDEDRLAIAIAGRPWAFDADGADFKLAAEALRIKLAHLFDPMMAVHTSNVEPLPHQISAVYESMLPRQPLRFVLADDPGAGKTIMAGLLIRELVMRADAQRILIVSPGSLTGQWQDELREKFGLDFEIFSRERQESCASGNYFAEQDRLIARLDQLARSEDYREKLAATHWDLIIVDEAHKLSASYFSGEIKKTQRFELGEMLGGLCRHFLLMTATPHNGKEEDFQLFLSLLDGDRFYGKFREGAHKVDVGDMMRRMVKEKLLRFDGTPLFPERRAYTANYRLSPAEAALYEAVTTYVREEMNRADKLDGKARNIVGFALTQLQRRLASSPEAIYQSLKRRRTRLEARLEETRLLDRGRKVREEAELYVRKVLDVPANLDEAEEEMSAEEYEAYSDQVVDQASSARTALELEAEILSLKDLEARARAVVESRSDSKWAQLSRMLHDEPDMRDAGGNPRKLIIFTEHRDTLNYLKARISDFLGKPEAVVTIHGGTNRDERVKVQELFRQDKNVLVLIATDAAGEGVNLQVANLMVNYDLPWNPNRIEQRFGRIHRIGQREVCHLWNLVASETREGEVFQKLFEKLEIERAALGGQVFDILGEAFEGVSLKDLLMQAIRYSELPETKARLNQVIDGALDTQHLRNIIERNALVDTAMSMEHLFAIKEEMDKAQARKLQPYFLRGFFLEAFQRIGGDARRREGARYEIPHVPALLRERDRQISDTRRPLLPKYERICFDKAEIHVDGRRDADLVHPAHPLMAALLDVVLTDQRPRLKQGTVLLDPADPGLTPSLLLLVDHSVREGTGPDAHTLSRRLQFVRIGANGQTAFAGWAPHLDLVPLDAADQARVAALLDQDWLASGIEQRALQHAAATLAPQHFQEVSTRHIRQIDKTHEAVRRRLTNEINYLSGRVIELEMEVKAGKQPRIQPENLQRRVEELAARLQRRERELETMRHIVSATPVIVGGALVIPAGLLAQLRGETPAPYSVDAAARAEVERRAMAAVMAAEQAMGHAVKDVSAQKCGWDITAQPPPREGQLPDARHIEVKGRAKGADVVVITRNEICTALNQGEKFWLAIVLVDGDTVEGPHYVPQPFTQEPEPGVTAVTFELSSLLSRIGVSAK